MKKIDELLEELYSNAFDHTPVVGICGHVRPDGDCIGSTLGLFTYLKENYSFDLHVYLEQFKIQFHNCLEMASFAEDSYDGKHFDLLFILDCSDVNRVGVITEPLVHADVTVCIDHHISNTGFGTYNHTIPTASSAAETLFDLLDYEKISQTCADCLMTGIVHDTGVFKHQNTKVHTMEVATALLRKEARLSMIINDTYYLKTFVQNKISGIAFETAFLRNDDRIICCVLTKEQMESVGANATDLDGIVDVLRGTEGVECAIFLYQTSSTPDVFKVSLRSNKSVNVSEIAGLYGGGGHIRAAGFSMEKQPDEIFEELIGIISSRMD